MPIVTKKILIGVGVIIIVLMAIGAIRFSFNARLGDNGAENSAGTSGGTTADQVKWNEYKSASFGYTVSYPVAWTVKEQASEGGGPDILISEPKGFAFVRIRGLYDPQIKSSETVKSSIEEYKNSFVSRGETLTNFKTGEIQNNVGEFFAFGEFKIKDILYRFEERGLLATNGRILIMRSSAIPQAFDVTISLMQKIMESFK